MHAMIHMIHTKHDGRMQKNGNNNKQCGRQVRRHGVPPTASNPDLCPFDLETVTLVASEVRNLPSKIWHARALRSAIIRYVCVTDGHTDEQTDESNAYCPPFYGRRHNKRNEQYALVL